MALRYSLHRYGQNSRESPPLSINLRLFVEPPGGFENQHFRTAGDPLIRKPFFGAKVWCELLQPFAGLARHRGVDTTRHYGAAHPGW